MQSEDGGIIVDGSIVETPYTAKHEMIGWYYEHAKQRSVTGINVVTCFCHCQGVSLPVWFERVRMTERSIDPNDGKEQHRLENTNNEIDHGLLTNDVKN